MSNEKIKLTVEIYKTETEQHEVIVDKETYEQLGNQFSVSDWVSEDTLKWTEQGNWDYDFLEIKEIK
tara:strand:- start:187 stop:387 length:201 start_codon:yes stop_codon:yes gene_type:complete